jgi:sensor domain CHASE-containing protein
MINGVFIINNQGKPRLSKFYEYLVRKRPSTAVARLPATRDA